MREIWIASFRIVAPGRAVTCLRAISAMGSARTQARSSSTSGAWLEAESVASSFASVRRIASIALPAACLTRRARPSTSFWMWGRPITMPCSASRCLSWRESLLDEGSLCLIFHARAASWMRRALSKGSSFLGRADLARDLAHAVVGHRGRADAVVAEEREQRVLDLAPHEPLFAREDALERVDVQADAGALERLAQAEGERALRALRVQVQPELREGQHLLASDVRGRLRGGLAAEAGVVEGARDLGGGARACRLGDELAQDALDLGRHGRDGAGELSFQGAKVVADPAPREPLAQLAGEGFTRQRRSSCEVQGCRGAKRGAAGLVRAYLRRWPPASSCSSPRPTSLRSSLGSALMWGQRPTASVLDGRLH